MMFIEKEQIHIKEEYNYFCGNFNFDNESDRKTSFYDHMFFLEDKNKLDEKVLSFLKNENFKKRNVEFYLHLSVSNFLLRSTKYLLENFKIDSNTYLKVYNTALQYNNQHNYLLSKELKEEKEKFKKEIFYHLLKKEIKFRAKVCVIKKLLKKLDKFHYYNVEKNILIYLLIFKIDSNFKDVNKLYMILGKKKYCNYATDYLKFIFDILKFTNLESIDSNIKKYFSDEEKLKKDLNKFCFEGSFFYEDFLNYNYFEKKIILRASKLLKKNIISKNNYYYMFNYCKNKDYNEFLNDKDIYYSSPHIYSIRFESNYNPKEDYKLKKDLDYVKSFLKNFNEFSINHLVEYHILLKLNNIINKINKKEDLKKKYFKESFREFFNYLAFRSEPIKNKLLNRLILRLYNKLNSSYIPLPISSLESNSLEYTEYIIEFIKKRYKISIYEFFFAEYGFSDSINQRIYKLKDDLKTEFEYFKLNINKKIDKKGTFYQGLYLEKLKKHLIGKEYLSREFLEIDVSENEIVNNLKSEELKLRYLFQKYQSNISAIKLDNVLESAESLSNISKDLKEDLLFSFLINEKKEDGSFYFFNKLKEELEIYDFENKLFQDKEYLDIYLGKYKKIRKKINKTKLSDFLSKHSLKKEIKKEPNSIKKMLYNYLYSYNGKIEISKLYSYLNFGKIKDVNHKRDMLSIILKQYFFDSDKLNFNYYINFDVFEQYGISEKKFKIMMYKYFEKKESHSNVNLFSFFSMIKEIEESLVEIYKNKKRNKFSKKIYEYDSKYDNNFMKINTKLFNFLFILRHVGTELNLQEDLSILDGFCSLNGDYVIRNPISADELISFSNQMNNCVKGYINRINNKEIMILNIYFKGHPHINISISNKKIVEIKQKYNKPVTDEEYQYFKEILGKTKIIE